MSSLFDVMGSNISIHIGHRDIEINLLDLAMSGSALSILYFLFARKSGFEDTSQFKKLKKQSAVAGNNNDAPYKPKDVPIPPVKGWFLNVYRSISRSNALRRFLVHMIQKQGEFDIFRQLLLPDPPTFYPIVKWGKEQSKTEETIQLETFIKPSDSQEEFHFNTISDYYTEYSDGSITPLQVARNVIKCIEDTCEKNLCIIIGMTEEHKSDILKRAGESTERWKVNKPLSVFDGVPVAVKDEMYLAQYVCRSGFPVNRRGEDITREEDEGWMVRKLRNGGALFIGVANMHQLGIGVTGINCSKLHGTARNPYNVQYPPGGSSSGSAAAVASGLCPIALGADGGGSIRIPSATCGIVGAKNTFARISGTGFAPGCNTVAHPGPLCATVQDAQISYGFLAGPDEDFELGLDQPAPRLTTDDMKEGITIGIDWNYFNDCEPEIRDCCKAAVDYVVKTHGMKVVDVSVSELQESMRAHVITILSEMYSYAQEMYEVYHNDINVETEIFLRLAKTISSSDYFKAQQQRTRMINILKRLFNTVDCFITPMSGGYMPKLDPGTLEYGCLDPKRVADIMRFAGLSNFTGHPSVAVPVGYSVNDGLPIGIQIQTAWWSEDLMYKIADAIKSCVTLKRPEIYYDVLHGSFDDVEHLPLELSINGNGNGHNNEVLLS